MTAEVTVVVVEDVAAAVTDDSVGLLMLLLKTLLHWLTVLLLATALDVFCLATCYFFHKSAPLIANAEMNAEKPAANVGYSFFNNGRNFRI